MAARPTDEFLAGVIEGFYGPPWSQAERFALFEWMAAWGLNTYLYAPKDDLNHRAAWREPYAEPEADQLKQVIQACKRRHLRFIYALGPGLDIRYSQETELGHLRTRFEQLLALGCQDFALLFDDIPDRLDTGDLRRYGSLAGAQCHAANAMVRWTRERVADGRFLFCPTPYCGRMAERGLGGEGYLSILGRELMPQVDVFWTGPEIISREITVAHIEELRTVLRRKPLIWDNLHANDYDGRRFFCGPYAGRPPELRSVVSGLLSNPNCEFPLNYVPLRTLARLVSCDRGWNPRQEYLAAMTEWLPQFATISQPVSLEDLILFGDCYYLPHEEGPEAEALYELARKMLAGSSTDLADSVAGFRRLSTRLREFCTRTTGLQHRSLFYALSRRVWELREELDLLERCAEFRVRGARTGAECRSDFHLPGTYRGGLVARLQRLSIQQPDGTFTFPARDSAPRTDKPVPHSAGLEV